MAKKIIKITYKRRAATSIFNIGLYIEDKGCPINAYKFINDELTIYNVVHVRTIA